LIVWGAADVPYKVWSMSVMPRSLAFTGHGGEMVLGTQTGVLRVYDPERSEAGAVLTAGRTAKSVLVYNQAHTGRVVGLNTRDGVLFSVSGGSFKVAGTLAGTAHEDDGRSNDVAGWRRGPTGGWTNAGIYLPRAEAYTGIGRSSDGQTIMLAIGKNLVEVWPIEAFQEAPPR
jgi:hypothetical protein